ncbi:MAG: DUF1116 domain-containing protein [Victivallaceae bacterium]|nr:DUF1116 domain-containing protein [Victivallaceae bacterium]
MNQADFSALEKLVGAEPILIGCRKAGEVVANMQKNMILHSGPEIDFDDMKGPHRKGIVGAALFEGLAHSEEEAEAMIRAGEIVPRAANDFNSGAPGAGITSYSMAVLVVREKHSGVVAVAPPIEGEEGGGLGGWGVFNDRIAENLRRISGEYAPLLDATLAASGGVNVAELFAEGLLMGDEEHTRQAATDKLFLARILEGVSLLSATSAEDKLKLLNFLNRSKRFVHHIGCASAVAALKTAANIPRSTLVTAMCGNGHRFGIKVSCTGEKWYTAPAPTFHGHYFNPAHTDADSSPWLGDSSNVEAWGLGGMAAAAAPALLAVRGETLWDGMAQCEELSRITIGCNRRFQIPTLPGSAAPAGILPELVVNYKITPKMHGGILSRVSGGQIGVGYARTPLLCFEEVLKNVR